MTTETTPSSTVPPSLRDQFLSREEAAQELSVHVDTVSRMIGEGTLVGQKYGRYTLVTRDSVQRYLNQFRHVAQ